MKFVGLLLIRLVPKVQGGLSDQSHGFGALKCAKGGPF